MKVHRTLILFLLFELALVLFCQVSSANGEIKTAVVMGDSAGDVSAFDVQSGVSIWSVQLGGDTRSVVVSSDGKFVAAGTSASLAVISTDGSLVWNKTLGANPTDPPPPYQSDTKLVAISHNGGYILAAHNDGFLRLYDHEGTELWNASDSATSVALSGDGTTAIAGGVAGIQYYTAGNNGVWDSNDSTPLWAVKGVPVREVASPSDGKHFVTGGRTDGFVRLFNGTGFQIWSYRNVADRISVDISKDGKSVVAGNDDRSDSAGAQLSYFSIGEDETWSSEDGIPRWSYRISSDPGDDIRAVAISANGSCIASGGSANYARTILHNVESSTPVFISMHGNEDELVAVSPDGRYVAAADSETNGTRLYDTAGSTVPLLTLNTTNKVRSVAIVVRVAPDLWVPSAQGVLFAGAVTMGLTTGASSLASALSSPNDFPSSSFAGKINEVLPTTLKKWLHEFISSKRKLAIIQRTGPAFALTRPEIASYAFTLSVLTLLVSYIKADQLGQIISLIPTVLATSIVVEFVRNYAIEVLAKKQGVWTEHRVWYFGLGMFLLSALLFKMPFSSPGRLVHYSPQFSKRSLGLVSAASVVIALLLAGVFYSLLTGGTAQVGNIGLILCLTIAFFEAMPIPPMNGKDIYDWSKPLWLLLFIIAFASYAICLLTL